MGSGTPDRVRVGAFELDLRAGELRSADGTIRRLQEQPFQILLMLLERAGGLVTREEIQKKLWPNDTVVEFDHSIHTAIKKLRQAFGDSGEDPRYVETVARRGYRLMLPVERSQTPVLALAAEEVTTPAANPSVSNLSHSQVTHYRVLEVLGSGGMGVVYKAEDLKLGRRVALKFLPEEIARDARALERFEREARAASALDHPNICTVFEFSEHDGHPFIAMALLEGQTLRDRIAERAGPCSLPELLNLSIQIADGLSAAHEKGIIHRDLKPANIFVTSREEVKILDFGLAKLSRAEPREKPRQEEGQTASAHDLGLSLVGVAVGTMPYMSPEQLRAEKVDARTDLFSLGLVIYEMATGKAAFHDDTSAQLREAILTRIPVSARQLNPALPLRLEEIINKALEKDREVRCQSAAEIRADLKRLRRDTESSPSSPPTTNLPLQKSALLNKKSLYGLVAVLLLSLGLGVGLHWFKSEPPTRAVFRERQLTRGTSENRLLSSALSPNGKYLVFVDTTGLHLNVIDTGDTHEIPLPAEIETQLWDVCWFPDGERVLLTAHTETEGYVLWMTSVFGGNPRKLRSYARFAAVSPQGSEIAFISHDREIWVMGVDGDNPRKVLQSENELLTALAWSPTGQRLAYIRRTSTGGEFGGSIETVSLAGDKPKSVISDPHIQSITFASLLWAADGRIFFAMREQSESPGTNLWQVFVNPQTGTGLGKLVKVTNWYGIDPWTPSLSRDGGRLAVIKTPLEIMYTSRS